MPAMSRSWRVWRQASIVSRGRRELRYYRALLRDPRTPRPAKWLLTAGVGYLFTPIDLIPDFIPLIGQLDDLVLVSLLVGLALRLTPDSVRRDARRRTRRIRSPDASDTTQATPLFAIEPLPATFGVRTVGLPLANLAPGDTRNSLVELLLEHQVVIIGTPSAPVASEHFRSFVAPLLAEAGSGFSIRCRVASRKPESKTKIINLAAAYRALPKSDQRTVEDQHVRDANGRPHPLVHVHPVTGRRVLSSLAACEPGKRRAAPVQFDSADLHDRLYEHVSQDQFRFDYRFHQGDLLLWDANAAVRQIARS